MKKIRRIFSIVSLISSLVFVIVSIVSTSFFPFGYAAISFTDYNVYLFKGGE